MTAYTPTANPTDVSGLRIGAWLIDLLVYIALLFAFTAITGGATIETREFLNAEQTEIFCDAWNGVNDGFCIQGQTNDEYTAITVEGAFGGLGFWALHLIGYSLLQGLTGASVGKLVVGLRVVTESGQVAGIGRSFVRTLAWIIDALTCGLPIIGGVMMVSSKQHRRVGDMIAGTFVVKKGSVGIPIDSAMAAPVTAWGDQSASWTPGPVEGSNPWNPSVSGPPVGGSPAAMPPTAPPAPSGQFGAGQASLEGPTWDAARNTYIQYDQASGEWLEWNDSLKTWTPISR